MPTTAEKQAIQDASFGAFLARQTSEAERPMLEATVKQFVSDLLQLMMDALQDPASLQALQANVDLRVAGFMDELLPPTDAPTL